MRPATTSSRCGYTVEKLCVGQLTTGFGIAAARKLNGMHSCRPPSYCGDFATESVLDDRTPAPVDARVTPFSPRCGDLAEDGFRPTRRPPCHGTTELFCGGPASDRRVSAQPLVNHWWRMKSNAQSMAARTARMPLTYPHPDATEHFRRVPLFQRPMNPILRMRCQSWATDSTTTHSFDDGASVRARSGRPKRAERETRQ